MNLFLMMTFFIAILNVLGNFFNLNDMLMNEKLEVYYKALKYLDNSK